MCTSSLPKQLPRMQERGPGSSDASVETLWVSWDYFACLGPSLTRGVLSSLTRAWRATRTQGRPPAVRRRPGGSSCRLSDNRAHIKVSGWAHCHRRSSSATTLPNSGGHDAAPSMARASCALAQASTRSGSHDVGDPASGVRCGNPARSSYMAPISLRLQ